MTENRRFYPIREWAEDDRPREKLLLRGKKSLTDAELMAILIGSGNEHETAVDLSKRILSSVENNLLELSKLSVPDLLKFKGIGHAKALSIIAALELGNREKMQKALAKNQITSSTVAYEYLKGVIGYLSYEVFYLLLLNRANKIIRAVKISEGGFAGTVADPKKIFKIALEYAASAIILCHNHPSGNLQPSDADIKLTNKLVASGELLDLKVLDHLILGDGEYFSFADENLI